MELAAEEVGLKEHIDKLSKEIVALEVYVDGFHFPTVTPDFTFAQLGWEREPMS